MRNDPDNPAGWDRIADHLKEVGPQFERAMKAAGSPLPPGVTGEDMLWSFIAQSRDYLESPEGKQQKAEFLATMNRLAERYPKKFDDPAFRQAMQEEVKRVFHGDESRGGASA